MNALLFFCLLLIFVINIKSFDYDIVNPAIVMNGAYLFSSLILMMNTGTWGNISIGTFLIIFVANVMMFIVCFVLKPRYNYLICIDDDYIPIFQTLMIVVFNFVVGLLYLREVFRIAHISGGITSIGSVMSTYRRVMLFSDMSNGTIGFNVIIMQLMKLSIGFAYVSLYKVCKLICLGYKLRQLKRYCLIITSFICIAWVQTSRLMYLQYILAGVFMIGIFLNTSSIREYLIYSSKTLGRIGRILVLFLALFFLTRNFLGRNAYTSFWDYLSVYSSGSLVGFDRFVAEKTTLLGENGIQKETFGAVYRFLYKLGIVEYANSTSLDFIYISSSGKTNVYTAMRRWMSDYGVCGLFMIQFFFSIFFAIAFRIVREKKSALLIITISFLYIAVATHFFDDMLFKNFCSVSFLIQLVCFYASYFFMEKIRISL